MALHPNIAEIDDEQPYVAPKNEWWGYKHISGTYQAKRFFDIRDIREANESDFVEVAVGPFLASNRDEALSVVKSKT